jgi:7-cyano-7-deazaguanine synthase
MKPEVIILLSGGIDSSALVNFYQKLGRPILNLFVNYGQPSAQSELRSAKSISNYYSVSLKIINYCPILTKKAGYIPARNAFLLTVALMERNPTVTSVAIGIHTGTNYSDCSELFLSKMQSVYDLYENGKIEISSPFIKLSKSEIYEYCKIENLPFELTYSCEAGNVPCGRCLSCKDRELLYDNKNTRFIYR